MTAAIREAVAEAKAEIRACADSEKAEGRKAYLKSELDVLGCGVPDVRRAAKRVKKAVREPDPAGLIEEIGKLRTSRVHDDRLLGILIAEALREWFDDGHVQGFFHDWLGECTNWDTVDALSTFVIGHVALKHPQAWDRIAAWTDDPCMWRRRASMLCHIPAIRAGQSRTEQIRITCDGLVDEKEFFIRKAMGWVIRELARFNLPAAEGLVREFGARMSGLTFREATRNMPKTSQAKLKKGLGR